MKPILPCMLCLAFAAAAGAMDLKKEVDLKGPWQFEIGNKTVYAEPTLDDSGWETIKAPGRWEDQGFPGYDGYAWYRKSFALSGSLRGEKLYLDLGRIDDVDRTWINGHLINGSGRFPPDYETAYAHERLYFLPSEFLNFGGTNVVAVQVYDDFEAGGITEGDIGVYSRRDYPEMVVDLTGLWAFRTGDDWEERQEKSSSARWDSLMVPLRWELQGYPEYDGYAWYRRTVRISPEYQDEILVLALGRIDDVDEVYFNGVRIGRTGHFPAQDEDIRNNDWWQRERFYTIPADLIRRDGPNTITVRIYDAWIDGGIYDGVIGIMTRKAYTRYIRRVDRHWIEMLEKWFQPDE